MSVGVGQRFRQGILALLAFARTVDYAHARAILTPEQMALFRQMARAEQLHSIQVLRTLYQNNPDVPHDLAVAALLHDVGKSKMHLSVAQKTVSILIKTFLPSLEARLTATEALDFWRGPFVVRRYHPKWGAELLAEVGAEERVIWLVRHHADPATQWRDHPNYGLLVRLQIADDAN